MLGAAPIDAECDEVKPDQFGYAGRGRLMLEMKCILDLFAGGSVRAALLDEIEDGVPLACSCTAGCGLESLDASIRSTVIRRAEISVRC